MSVYLPPKLQRIVREKVASGAYRDEGEVLRKALELLARYDAEVGAKRDALRGMILEGIESGAPRDTDIDAFIDELNAKLDRR